MRFIRDLITLRKSAGQAAAPEVVAASVPPLEQARQQHSLRHAFVHDDVAAQNPLSSVALEMSQPGTVVQPVDDEDDSTPLAEAEALMAKLRAVGTASSVTHDPTGAVATDAGPVAVAAGTGMAAASWADAGHHAAAATVAVATDHPVPAPEATTARDPDVAPIISQPGHDEDRRIAASQLAAMGQVAHDQPDVTSLRVSPRTSRTKTRLLGFDKTRDRVVDLFETSTQTAPTARALFPVGWVVVETGPGRGESFALQAGMSLIGRGEDQAIQLDFGDMAISRSQHAAIVYDEEKHTFLLGHGGKSNIVRLNDAPVIMAEQIRTGDRIRIGETTLRFVALCDIAFNWTVDGSKGRQDVSIA